jgi:hypothetical protein
MVLSHKQTWKRIEQNTRPRHKIATAILLLTKEPKTYNGENPALLTNVAWKTGYPYATGWN